MHDLTPRQPRRPLIWTDTILDLQELFDDATIYIVGGAVRDAYLHRPLHDLDLMTPGHPLKVARRIADTFDGDVYVLDEERGVARAIIDRPDGHYVIDVAAMRGDDLIDDLTDRDFTFNAIAVDLSGDLMQIIDPLDGETDLFDRVLRQCRPDSLHNDPIRVLRAIRQSTQFNAHIEPETLANIRAVAPLLSETSAERVRDEFFKLLSLPKAHAALRVADHIGILGVFLPEITPLRNVSTTDGGHMWDRTLYAVEKMGGILDTVSPRRTDLSASVFDLGMIVMSLDRYRVRLQTHIAGRWPDDRSHEALLRLMALLSYADSAHLELELTALTETRARALRLSNEEIKRLHAMSRAHRTIADMLTDDLTAHRFWRQYGVSGIDVCLIGMSVYLAERHLKLDQDEWIRLLERIQTLFDAYFERYETVVEPPTLLDGDELMQTFNLKPGKRIGQLLQAIREAQVLGKIHSRDDALAFVRETLR